MLVELAVTDLGVIDRARLLLGPGLTALTGETGAGKTMLVEAIALLLGRAGRPRPGAPGGGRGRGRGALRRRRRRGGAHPGGAPRRPVPGLRRRPHGHRRRPGRAGPPARRPAGPARPPGAAHHGGPARGARPRRRHRPGAAPHGAPSGSPRSTAGWPGWAATPAPGPARSTCCATSWPRSRRPAWPTPTRTPPSTPRRTPWPTPPPTGRRPPPRPRPWRPRAVPATPWPRPTPPCRAGRPFADLAERLAGALAEVEDLAGELRDGVDRVVDDPERLALVRERRQLLVDLTRKYGSARAEGHRGRHPGRRARLRPGGVGPAGRPGGPRRAGRRPRRRAGRGRRRRGQGRGRRGPGPAEGGARGWPPPSPATCGPWPCPGAEVRSPWAPPTPATTWPSSWPPTAAPRPCPVAKVASGGELARTDAGPAPGAHRRGAHPGVRRGRRRDRRARRPWPWAGPWPTWPPTARSSSSPTWPRWRPSPTAQIGVTKRVGDGSVTSQAVLIEGDERVVELSRMLSGTPDSPRVREAAAELLATAAATRSA